MKQVYYVGGSRAGCGKTLVARGLIRLLREHGKVGALKPVEVGQLAKNAAERLSDGELLHQAAAMEEHPNLVHPYFFNTDFPPAFAAKNDGVKLQEATIHNYWQVFERRFDYAVIEGARGLLAPLTQKRTELDWIQHWRAKVIWVCQPTELDYSLALMQSKLLRDHDVEIAGLVLNNQMKCRDGEWLHHFWITLEELSATKILGMIPLIEDTTEVPHDDHIAQCLRENLDLDFLNPPS